MKQLLLILLSNTFLSFLCLAQNQANSYLFGRNPYAAAEAMGGANTAIGNNLYSVFYNPAGIQNLKGIEVAGSIANKYSSIDGIFVFSSVGLKWNKYLTTAFTYHAAYYDQAGIYQVSTTRPPLQKFTVTIASEPFKNFNIGININRFEFNQYYKTNALCLDAGIQYKLYINKKSRLLFGSEMKNLNRAEIKYDQSPIFSSWAFRIPTIGSTGIAYQNSNLLNSERFPLGFIAQIEYGYVVPQYGYNTLGFGTEFKLWNQLSLRAGVKQDPLPAFDGIRHNAFTYGLGWNIILDNYDYFKGSRNEWQIDFCSLPQRPYEFKSSNTYYTDYIILSIMFKHHLSYKKQDCLTCPSIRNEQIHDPF